ncbi:MAG: type II toxin-antitoxin system RelB family antitoxin [Luteimonas sp.]
MTIKTQTLDPLISEFQTEAQAASHDRWFRAQVQVAIDDPRPSVPHDEAMARVRETIEAAKRKSTSP